VMGDTLNGGCRGVRMSLMPESSGKRLRHLLLTESRLRYYTKS